MDNISEFILHTTEEAKRRGLEISIASVSLAKPVEMPAVQLAENGEAVRAKREEVEAHSWILLSEAARMLRVSMNTLYRYIQKGIITGKKDQSGHWVVPTTMLENFQKIGTSVPVRCLETGIVYPSFAAAATDLHVSATAISRAISRKYRCKNLTFEKVDS